MIYKNKTDKPIQVRLDDGKDSYIWKFVEPNKEAELNIPEDYAGRIGLIVSKENDKKDVQPVQATESTIGKTIVETKQINNFLQDLISLKGVGPSYANDIIIDFPEEKDLREAIKNKQELPFRKDVNKILEKKYG